MQHRILFASNKPKNYQRRGRRPSNVCGCCITLMMVILCHLLLAGCAGPAKVANKSATQTTPDEPSGPLVPSGTARQSQNVSHGPIMTFEKTVHDFGQVGPRSKNVCEFRFKNTGMDTLRVERRIQSTCGCAAPLLTKNEYAPGEEGAIQVTYTAAGIPVTAQKDLTVHSNDKENPQVRLRIIAKVASQVACEPRQLNLRLKDAATCPITLRSLDGTPFSVTGMLCTGDGITADLDPSIQATEFTIQPMLDVEKLQRLPEGFLKLTLTHPECKEVRIRYQIWSGFQFFPASLMLYNVEPNRPVQRIVQLSNIDGEDFEIESISSDQNFVDVLEKTKIAPRGKEGARYRIKVSVKPPVNGKQKGFFTDTLFVRLTDGQTQKLDCHGFYNIPQAAAGPYPPP